MVSTASFQPRLTGSAGDGTRRGLERGGAWPSRTPEGRSVSAGPSMGGRSTPGQSPTDQHRLERHRERLRRPPRGRGRAPKWSARNKPSSVPSRGRIIPLGPSLPTASSSLPGTRSGRAAPRPLFGLAPGGVCRATAVTSGPVRSYRTLSPLPVPPEGGHRRSPLCGTFRRLATPGRYPAPCPAELGLSSSGRSHQRSSLATLHVP